MEKITFMLINEQDGWEPNLKYHDLPASVKRVRVRKGRTGGWDIIAAANENSFPKLGGSLVRWDIPKREGAEKIALLWLAGQIMKEPVRDFRRAAFIHNFRQPECAKAAAALSRAQELGRAADLVTSTFSEVRHDALCAALPRAVEAARAACAAFAAAPKSPSVEIQSEEQALADDLKGAADLLDAAHQRARHFHLSAGVDIIKKLAEKTFDDKTR